MTMRAYGGAVRRWQRYASSQSDLPDSLRLFFVSPEAENCAPATKNLCKAALRRYLTWLAEQPDAAPVKDNVESGVRYLSKVRFKQLRRLPDVLDDGECHQIRQALQDKVRQANGNSANALCHSALFELLIASGLRISEALALTPADVNFAEQCVRVRCGKGGRERLAELNHTADDALRAYLAARPRQAHEPLFPISRIAFSRTLKWAARTAEVDKPIHPHALRHYFCTTLVRRGVSIPVVKELAGHANIATTMTYVNLTRQEIRARYDAAMETNAKT